MQFCRSSFNTTGRSRLKLEAELDALSGAGGTNYNSSPPDVLPSSSSEVSSMTWPSLRQKPEAWFCRSMAGEAVQNRSDLGS
jgi:hypothetical protein